MEPVETTNRHDDRLLHYALAAVAGIALICGLYCEEDWRGHHIWNQIKQHLEANGGRVDWTNYVPAPVPEGENFFGAPKMQKWFVGRGSCDLSARLNSERESFLTDRKNDTVARVTVVQPGEKVADGEADIILDYDPVLSAISLASQETLQTGDRTNEIVPIIVMRDVPLSDAIKLLARAAGLKYVMSGKVTGSRTGPEPTVSARWEKVTAREALASLLKNYDLQYVPDSKNEAGRIIVKDSNGADAGMEPAAKDRLQELIMQAIGAATNELHGRCAYSAMGFLLAEGRTPLLKPVRVVVRVDKTPGTNEVAALFPAMSIASYAWAKRSAQVIATDSNFFEVRFNPPVYVSAQDYLTWSEGFAGDFTLIREALKRPRAQMNGDYRSPSRMPVPNFVCARILAQTLTDRAKCHLLTGQPEAAVEDLALVRGLCRTMEGWPGKKPGTLVATMINAAVTALYVDTIADGIRLRAWRDPELAALQEQLKEIDLPPFLTGSFELERAASCHTLESVKPDDFIKLFTGGTAQGFWDKMKDPTYVLLKVAPRGWVYQNMVKIATMDGKLMDGFDVTNRRVSSRKIEHAIDDAMAELHHFKPYNYLALVMVPNFSRAVQTLSRNQCMADEAVAACGLERYRLAHGRYPESLDALVPQYLEKIPRDIINGEPLKYHLKGDDRFVLYSVGWNEKDDGGEAGPKKDGASDVKLGDWVWADPNK